MIDDKNLNKTMKTNSLTCKRIGKKKEYCYSNYMDKFKLKITKNGNLISTCWEKTTIQK